jgi:flavodoxin
MAGKGLIVYYSWTGNTEAVANEIKAQTSFDILRIDEMKERKNGSVAKAACSAFMGMKSRIKQMDFLMKDYDRVILGAQVWAGKTTPAVNAYLKKADFKGKKVWLFITKADDKVPQKIIDSITKRIENKGGTVMNSISFTTTMKTVISPEKFKDDLKDWLIKNHLI